MKFFATAPKGVASVLFQELRSVGIEQIKEQPAGVAFEGNLESVYRVCLWSRTASRVLLPLATFRAETPEALYAQVGKIDWDDHLHVEDTLAVDFSTRRSAITHSAYGARRVKDAIVDQFRERMGRRPSVAVERPAVRINCYLFQDQATLSIDLSGESLHKRGYRQESVAAPLKENLAAALLLRGGWSEIAAAGGCLVDPMCGSGTFLIEAALLAADSAPGRLREYFGFFGWRQHQADVWQALLQEAAERRARGLESMPPIYGYDHELKAVRAAQANVVAAGVDAHVRISRRALAGLKAPSTCERGLVMVNPPYGERMGEREQLGSVYAQLGACLKQAFVGWKAAVFTGNPDLAKQLRIRARRLHAFYNGALECKLLRFDLDSQYFMEATPGRLRPASPDELGPGAEMLANRLRKNLKELGRWARREAINCYRLYDADMPEYAVAVDIYASEQRWAVVQEYAAPKSVEAVKAKQRLREALAVIPEVLEIPPVRLFFKVRKRQKGAAQYAKLADADHFHEIVENGCRFLVNFEDYLDTGLFLDHRLTRALIGRLAQGRRVLNLFGYTGTATVYAALGGAQSTTTVDMSKTYLDWAQRNLRLNGCGADKHAYIQADCMQWLREQARKQGPYRRRYGLIFLDPPTFSTSKRMQDSFDVQRDHAWLIAQAMALMEPDGVLIFSNNFRRFRLDQAVSDAYAVQDITRETIPKDFARNAKIHNCWKILPKGTKSQRQART